MGKSNNSAKPQAIHLKGIRQNNLKGVDIDIPLGKLTAVTGLSGSGKSSLVFETLHAEGQRRYVETFSAYTRQFLELMDKPEVESVRNMRPSIAIDQTNNVKTSRSTVGTMTELCDYFKVWFWHVADLIDPATNKPIHSDTPQSVWKKTFSKFKTKEVLLCFEITKPDNFTFAEIADSLKRQGFTRVVINKKILKLDDSAFLNAEISSFLVIQDRITIQKRSEARFIESITNAWHYGDHSAYILDLKGKELAFFTEKLISPKTSEVFKKATPAHFSFNSPIGACPECRGFGRVIEIDYNLVIPDKTLTLEQGAIRAFSGEVYGESLKDLLRNAKKLKIRTNIPWNKLTKKEQELVIEGDPNYQESKNSYPTQWYGVRRFFAWLESRTYKMHVRFVLAKYRSYTPCTDCNGDRLKPESLYWKWKGYTLPDLYNLSVKELLALFKKASKKTGNHPVDIAAQSISTRLRYLDEVGLGYLTLNRTSRTLSGGETQRVNLTTCLGTSLIDTLFVLDEPSVGLHCRDIDRLIKIIRRLTDLGNTVVVVEHDESIIAAADHILEVGPEPGSKGGQITFQGPAPKLLKDKNSLTAKYLRGDENIDLPIRRRSIVRKKQPHRLEFKGVSKNNLENIDITIPLKQLVGICGVSGSGKSTLLNNVIHQGLLADSGKSAEDPAVIKSIKNNCEIDQTILVDQSTLSKTPRSNPALFIDAWDAIRGLFSHGIMGQAESMRPSHFSFNSGSGRCDHCTGLGYEKVEMQFLSDVYVTCPVCEGKRFKPEVLAVKWNHKSIADILNMDINQAIDFFRHYPKVTGKLKLLQDVGLGYLGMGQPLNTLSGGESQRLKLVKFLSKLDETDGHTLLLLDEPTTGLHRDDIKRLIKVLQRIVTSGHSIVVIEHQTDILKSADWLIEMGPEAGADGGQITASGTPEQISRGTSQTAGFLKDALAAKPTVTSIKKKSTKKSTLLHNDALELVGAREHNLRDVSVSIPHKKITALTGVSGSGKSSLAFDIVFAEGQRRFLESISPYARQFIEQLARPDIDQLTGVAPTVAIEQRITRGSFKSTVATITEVAQYLRLMYARIGTQYSPVSGKPVVAMSVDEIFQNLEKATKQFSKSKNLYLCSSIVRARKGHHQPIANWAETQGYKILRIDGEFVNVDEFEQLDRYKEHDIDLVLKDLKSNLTARMLREQLDKALEYGRGACFLLDQGGKLLRSFSTKRNDPDSEETYPDLDPKHFSWNSPRGWCPACHGHGHLQSWMRQEYEEFPKDTPRVPDGTQCPACEGTRLNRIARNVKIASKNGELLSLPDLLSMTASELLESIQDLDLDKRSQAIVKDIFPQISERLSFMDEVGLNYLTLDRPTNTLSGGEAQRIRLAGQLSSNLSGVLYVLDEPSIGLHARDSTRLIDSLKRLKDKGNTVLVVEHDEDTILAADHIIDLGPGAGIHGGEVLAAGNAKKIIKTKNSLTGEFLQRETIHPLRGKYRPLPKKENWVTLKNPKLRNLKGGELKIPVGRLTMVCGISGAGKSTLIRDLLKPTVEHAINKQKSSVTAKDIELEAAIGQKTAPFKELIGGNNFKKIIEVDQEPIGKTLRSTPATYIGAFDIIRDYYATLPEAQIHGFNKSYFSFNTKQGRCQSCDGAGRVKLEMSFLPDTFVECEACNGRRYGSELEEIRWNGKNIMDVLDMSFEEAVEFFDFNAKLKKMMQLMVDTGLGYLKLGQASPTLSGGEAQRLKLVTELAKGELISNKLRSISSKTKNLYILEEPTIGLHLSDCERLIHLLHDLVDQGHTVIVIEHHLDLIAEADYLVEIGPEGGINGGEILYQGPTKSILKCKKSQTASFLKPKLD